MKKHPRFSADVIAPGIALAIIFGGIIIFSLVERIFH